MKVLLTSGGTKTLIDEVRHVGNMSNGTFGNHICKALLDTGNDVNFLYAKGSKCLHELRLDLRSNASSNLKELVARMTDMENYEGKYNSIQYYDYNEYSDKLIQQLIEYQPQIVILAAAVSDYAPVQKSGKISSEFTSMSIELKQTKKLIRIVKDIVPSTYLVGFKLLVGSSKDELIAAMKNQIENTRANLVIGNDIRDIRSDNHKLTIMDDKGEVTFTSGYPGSILAEILVQKIVRDYKKSH
jgi:phosphopantothenate-cysteine ligase